MKLYLTTVAVDTFTVIPKGKTIGETINDMIVHNMQQDLIVTEIKVEVTAEDTAALRLLQSPAFQETDTTIDRPNYAKKQTLGQAVANRA